MQSQSHVLDDLAQLLSNAAGAAQGVRQEIETLVRHQAERLIADFDLVTREEFEAVRAMSIQLEKENRELRKRVKSLEKTATKTPAKKRVSK